MNSRKKKLITFQVILFFIGSIVIYQTYYNKKVSDEVKVLSDKEKKIVSKLNKQEINSSDVFYDIQYSGIDLAGNRYILKSKEARNSKINSELVEMKLLEAMFYFKDDTILKVFSDKGVYNNKTLDMTFEKKVKALYGENKLFAEKAYYSNQNSFLKVSGNVIVNDQRGNLVADELLFDIKKQNLNIISLNSNRVNAKIDLE